MSLAERWEAFWRGAPMPATTFDCLGVGDGLGAPQAQPPFQSGRDYIEVILEEMFLAKGGQWFTTFDPMVVVVTELSYDHKRQTIPFVLGPPTSAKPDHEPPHGMRFANIRVAGLYPYGGGGVKLTVILYRVARGSGTDLLRIVQKAAALVPAATALTTYLKIGELLLDGLESLCGLHGATPLIGVQHELFGKDMRPSRFLLAGQAAGADGEGDHVLYAVRRHESRDDETTLPFYPLYERVLSEAAGTTGETWESARHNFTALVQQLLTSPDLTEPQKDQLWESYRRRVRAIHAHASTQLGKSQADNFAHARTRSLKPLEV